MKNKANALLAMVDWQRSELKKIKQADCPAEALVKYLSRRRCGNFRFEYWRKDQVLKYLRTNYGAWQKYDCCNADRISSLTIEQAQGARALGSIATLGQAWWATGDPKYGAAFERFYTSVPTGEMFNWGAFNGSQGSGELNAWFLLKDCPAFSTKGRIAFLHHLCAITDYAWDDATSQWGQLELGPEGHNWYLHGMHVLPFMALLFPELKRSAFFWRTGWSVIEEHLRGHYKDDGGARETTLGYQHGSMQCMWDFYLIAKRNKRPVSWNFEERLLNATKFILRMMTPDGTLPSYGDTQPSHANLTGLAAMATALTGDGECKWYAEYARKHDHDAGKEKNGSIPLTAFWRVGLQGAAVYEKTRVKDPKHVSVLMGPTGYVAMRNSDNYRAAYMALAAADRGPIVTSHGHNEIFSIEAHADGQRFIGEMGCVGYGDSPGRMYDQTTAAHSTLVVEGMEQVPLASEWRWLGRVSPVVRRWISKDTHDFFHGVHEGYFNYRTSDLLHARKVFFVKSRPGGPGYWIVLDWTDSHQKRNLKAYFHGVQCGKILGDKVILGDMSKTHLAIVPPANETLKIKQEKSRGLAAYIREKKLNADEYPCFSYTKRTDYDCLAWVVVPLGKGESAPRVKRLPVTLNGIKERPYGATAVEVRFAGHTDTLCVSHKEFDGDILFGRHETHGIIAFRRHTKAGRQTMAIDHTVIDGVCGR